MSKPVFRIITEEEKQIVIEAIRVDFDTESLEALQGYSIWIKEGKIKEVFAVPQSSSDLILKTKNIEVHSAGVPIGSIWSDKFQLEIEGAKMFSRFAIKRIFVETDQFLYGKPIFKENVSGFKEAFEKNDPILVIGKNNLFYGIGRAEVNSSEFESLRSNTIIIRGSGRKPLDVGWYLRAGN
jgi:ribosome biogenesis protein Nip4